MQIDVIKRFLIDNHMTIAEVTTNTVDLDCYTDDPDNPESFVDQSYPKIQYQLQKQGHLVAKADDMTDLINYIKDLMGELIEN